MRDGDEVSRRELLRAGAALGVSGLAYGAPAGPASARASRCTKSLEQIEHIVILMQENRSFDEFLGTFPGVRGFDDMRNRQAFAQPGYRGRGSRDGRLLPFHVDGRRPSGQCSADPTHDWTPQHHSWNSGRNDRFYEVHSRPVSKSPDAGDGPEGINVMGYYRRQDIPYTWALARAYTVCDMYFCSVLGPTMPNRCYAVSATLDPEGKRGGPCLETVFVPPSNDMGPLGQFRWTTMPEQLEARRISWKSYTARGTLGGQYDNPFTAFAQFLHDPKLNRLGIQPVYPYDFWRDMDRGEMPTVSWIQVPFSRSEHGPHPVGLGEFAIDHVLRAIWARPHIWRKTAVIVNYDENGGFFDHVPPPTAPSGTKGEFLAVDPLPATAGGIRGPVGLGFRVPCIIVSPWTRGGFVCSDTFDHTSVLRLIERRFGAEVPNLTAWRRKTTGDMTSAFNFAAGPDYSIPKLPRTSATSASVTTGACKPPPEVARYPIPAQIDMPRQEPGRPRRPSGLC